MERINQRSVDTSMFGNAIGKPNVIPFGVSTDGHLSTGANTFLKHLSTIKFEMQDFIEGSVAVKRAQWIGKWVLQLQAGVTRASARALDLGLAQLKDWRRNGLTCEGARNDAYTQRAQEPSASSRRPPARITVGNTTFTSRSAAETSS